MIDPSSRYSSIETTTLTTTVDGESRTIRYLRRRLVPRTDGLATLVKHPVRQGDRLDNIAALYFTDPTQFWRICDSNGALRPDELVEKLGRQLSIVLPLR